MASSFASGFAGGFAGTFVPAYQKYIEGKKAARGMDTLGKIVGESFQDAGLGQMVTQAGKIAIANGADPAKVTSEMFQSTLGMAKSRQNFLDGLADRSVGFAQQSSLELLRQRGREESSKRSAQLMEHQANLFERNEAAEQGRDFLMDIYRQTQQNKRAELEADTRRQGIDAKGGIGGLNQKQSDTLKKMLQQADSLRVKIAQDPTDQDSKTKLQNLEAEISRLNNQTSASAGTGGVRVQSVDDLLR